MLTDQKLPGYRFPLSVIGHAVWLYHRYALNYRDVEALLFERGTEVSRESVRTWCINFSDEFAQNLRHREPWRGSRWHLDEMHVVIGGVVHWLWRAVDEHGAVLDVFLQRHRDTSAATSFFQRLLGEYHVPETVCTDKLASYGAAIRELPTLDDVDHQQVVSSARCNNLIEQRASVLKGAVLPKTISSAHTTSRTGPTGFSAGQSDPRISRLARKNHQPSRLYSLDYPRSRPTIFLENRAAKLEGCRTTGGLKFRPPATIAPRLPPASNNLPEHWCILH